MTRRAYARLAGFMFLFYIANGVAAMVVFNRITSNQGVAGTLASIVQHAPLMRLTIVLTLLTAVDALVLAVALYAITRDHDPDLAMLALAFRIGEGMVAANAAVRSAGLLALATRSAGPAAADAAAANALGDFLLHGSGTLIGATLFAFGSTIYSYLFLRARSIPLTLAWLGVVASVLLLLGLPLQLAGVLHGPVTNYIWIPMALFEVALALWLLIKGVAER